MRTRVWILPLLLFLVNAPAAALLMDDEPANNAIGTAAFDLTGPGGGLGFAGDGGILELQPGDPGDVDFIGLMALVVGDIVTATTTPLDLEGGLPDTILGLFTSDGTRVAFNDDSPNGDGDPGSGSLIRYEITEAGDYYVGVSGAGDDELDFTGDHFEQGRYMLLVGIASIPEPGTALLFASGVAGLAAARRRRLTH